ncbi:MAG: DUF5050 domain-containing protein [Lachnospiraceae bacterium]|nr:DUF5050 domain-containing protein [Lachnospiraceae bacterium]
MKKVKIFQILFVIVLVVILLTSGILYFLNSRTKLNESYVNGNTAGNLYNGGLFCENGDTLYFANPADHFRLYSMPIDGGPAKKLSKDTVTFINADKNYIYYARNNKNDNSDFSFLRWNNNSLCRIKKNGKNFVVVENEPSMYVSLLGNYLYYLHYDKDTATSMYRVKIDGSEKEMVEDQPYYTCSTNGSYLYYNGLKNDHHIYSLNTATGNSQTLYDGNCWMPIVDGNVAYYMDVDHNYRLAKVNLNTKETQILTDERIDCFNLYGDYIYYARNEEPALCRMKIDGSEQEELIDGMFTDINITSHFVYFRQLNEPNTFYRTPTSGDAKVTVFRPTVEK